MTSSMVPYNNELPSQFAGRVAADYSCNIPKGKKKQLGQFFTPVELAKFMLSMTTFGPKKEVKLLDPGCGVLILTCVFVESALEYCNNIESIEIDAFDIDPSLIGAITTVSNYLTKWCKTQDIRINLNYNCTDFIIWHKEYTSSDNAPKKYDFVISNPPYFKIRKNDLRLSAFKDQLRGQQNIYSLFLLISSEILECDGQLVFIVPRSFASGLYFQSFRELFFRNVLIDFIHVFHSRKDGFKQDNVLQENVIIRATKRMQGVENTKVKISSSFGINDVKAVAEREFFSNQLIKKLGQLDVIHIPVNSKQVKAMELFSTWSNNLISFGLKVSTGPVVPFRSSESLKYYKEESLNCVPFLWMHNCKKMKIVWPLKGTIKESWIVINSKSNSKTIKNRNYVFLRRFSSKEDKSKIVAAPHLQEDMNFENIGVENHLNYLYRPGGNMDILEVFGLSVLYNSSLFDFYFRALNGNTQISATELNFSPLPSIEVIHSIGKQYLSLNEAGIDNINNIVNSAFGLLNEFRDEQD